MDLKEHFKPTALKLAVIGVLALLAILYLVQVPGYMQKYGEGACGNFERMRQADAIELEIKNSRDLSDEQILEKIAEREDLSKADEIATTQSFLYSPAAVLNMIVIEIIPLPFFPSACRHGRQTGCFDYMDKETFKCTFTTYKDRFGEISSSSMFTGASSLKDYKPFVLPKAILQAMALAAIIYIALSLISAIASWAEEGGKKRKLIVLGIAWCFVLLPFFLSSLFPVGRYYPIMIFSISVIFTIIYTLYLLLKTNKRRTIFLWIIIAAIIIGITVFPIIGSYYIESELKQRITENTIQWGEYSLVECNESIKTIETNNLNQCFSCPVICSEHCSGEKGKKVLTRELIINGEHSKCACSCGTKTTNREGTAIMGSISA